MRIKPLYIYFALIRESTYLEPKEKWPIMWHKFIIHRWRESEYKNDFYSGRTGLASHFNVLPIHNNFHSPLETGFISRGRGDTGRINCSLLVHRFLPSCFIHNFPNLQRSHLILTITVINEWINIFRPSLFFHGLWQ